MKKNEIHNGSPSFVIKNEHSVLRMVRKADIVADVDGRYLLKSGTIVGHATGNIITDNLPITAQNNANGKGIVMNTVDVTNGDLETAVLVRGVVKEAYVKTANSGTVNAAVDFKGQILLTNSGM